MLRKFESTIKWRVAIVFCLVHLGLAATLFATARLSVGHVWDPNLLALSAGLFLMYLGTVIGAFLLVWPLLPWFRRASAIKHWGQTLVSDLPKILESIEKIAEAMGPIVRAWKENKPSSSTASDSTTRHANLRAR